MQNSVQAAVSRVDIDPAVHMGRAARTNTPVMVIAGDSISTEEPTLTFDETSSFWGRLQREVTEANPDVTWTFHNRAIGGARYDHLNDVTLDDTGLSLPDWATNPTVDGWLDKIEALEPDVLLIAFGMNDRDIFDKAQFRAAMQKIGLWAKVPDIVFVSNMVPNFYDETPTLGTEFGQNGRLFVQHYTRTYALYHGHGLIDVGRFMCKSVAGFDPRQTHLREKQSAAGASIPYTAPFTTDQDVALDLTFEASAGLWATRIKSTISYQGPNAASWLEIYDDGGSLAVEFVDIDDVSGRYLQHTSTISTPTTGALNLSIFVKDNNAKLKVNGEVLFQGNILRNGGRFSPEVSFLDGRTLACTVTSYKANFCAMKPVLSYAKMYGSTSVSNDVEGGNDLNHPTDRGAAYVFGPILDATDWRLDRGHVSGGVLRSGGVIDAMPNQTTHTLPTPAVPGTFYLWSTNSQVAATVGYNSSAAPENHYSLLGSNTQLASAGTDLTGTTGPAGIFTISVKDGEIELENNRGLQIGPVHYMFMGPKE